MRRGQTIAAMLLAVACSLWLSPAQAQSGLDVTMTMVMDDETLSETVVQEIELPEPSTQGLRGSGQLGPGNGSASREYVRTLGEHVAEQARESRERRERGGGRPGPVVPEAPARPERLETDQRPALP
jgi:hypothetical protein